MHARAEARRAKAIEEQRQFSFLNCLIQFYLIFCYCVQFMFSNFPFLHTDYLIPLQMCSVPLHSCDAFMLAPD